MSGMSRQLSMSCFESNCPKHINPKIFERSTRPLFYQCFRTSIPKKSKFLTRFNNFSGVFANDGRVPSLGGVDSEQTEIYGLNEAELEGGEAEGRNERMMRHLKQIGAFGLPAVMVPLADPGEIGVLLRFFLCSRGFWLCVHH
jgi:hypothetical protein